MTVSNGKKLIYLFMINHKMFVEVDAEDLVVGTEYAILWSYDVGIYQIATFKCHRWYENDSPEGGITQTFNNPKEYSGIENENTYNILLSMRNKNNDPNYFALPKKN